MASGLTAPQRRCLELLAGRARPTSTSKVGGLMWAKRPGKNYRYTLPAFALLDRLNGMSPPLVSCRARPYADSYEWEITDAGRAVLTEEASTDG